jgi:hypothetical protein
LLENIAGNTSLMICFPFYYRTKLYFFHCWVPRVWCHFSLVRRPFKCRARGSNRRHSKANLSDNQSMRFPVCLFSWSIQSSVSACGISVSVMLSQSACYVYLSVTSPCQHVSWSIASLTLSLMISLLTSVKDSNEGSLLGLRTAFVSWCVVILVVSTTINSVNGGCDRKVRNLLHRRL